MAVEKLIVGDIVVVKPDERIAADGFVIKGESSVDQSPITGESIPVDKEPVADREAAAAEPESIAPVSRVFAGTINQAGVLEIQVTKTAAENTLARVVTMVNDPETRVSPTQRFTKRFELYFVPSVITVVATLLFAPLVSAYLSKTTWSISDVVRLYLKNLNWEFNAETACGPTPCSHPKYAEFLAGISALQRLQDRKLIAIFSEAR